MLISRANERHIFNQGKFIIRMISPGKKLNDPKDPFGLGPLGRFDHSTLEAERVIAMHPHVNDEILSYMRKGKMLHRDSEGKEELLHGTHMMMMNAGREIWHEETCLPEPGNSIEMLQIFFRPSIDNLAPRVQFHEFETYESVNNWRLIGGPETSEAPLKIRSEAFLHDIHLNNTSIETPALPHAGVVGLLYVFEGSVGISGTDEMLKKGDNLVTHSPVNIHTTEQADLVHFTLDTQSTYSRNGMYAR